MVVSGDLFRPYEGTRLRTYDFLIFYFDNKFRVSSLCAVEDFAEQQAEAGFKKKIPK